MMSLLLGCFFAVTVALRPVNRPKTALKSATLPLPQQEPFRDPSPAAAVRDDGTVVLGGDTVLEPARSRRRGATKLADVETARETARNGGCFLSFSLRKAKSKVDVDLGLLPPGRILSIARNKRWWITPAFGEVPIESQAVLVEGEEDDEDIGNDGNTEDDEDDEDAQDDEGTKNAGNAEDGRELFLDPSPMP